MVATNTCDILITHFLSPNVIVLLGKIEYGRLFVCTKL